MTLVRLIAATYWFVAMPLLLGMAWNKVKKESKPMIATTFTEGYLIWFALFFVGVHVKQGPKAWMLFVALLSVACLVILNKTLVERIKARFEELKNFRRNGILFASLAMSAFSVLFVMPSLKDDVLENGDFLFYTIPANIFGLSLGAIVHRVAAFGLLLFFFATYRSISFVLYKEEKKRLVFFAVAVLYYAVMTIGDVPLQVAVFQNVWNPTTLFFSCNLPLSLTFGVKLCLQKKAAVKDKREILCDLMLLLCSFAAAQLVMDFGAGLCLVLFLLGIVMA